MRKTNIPLNRIRIQLPDPKQDRKLFLFFKIFNEAESLSQGGYLPTSRAEPCGSGEWWLTTRPAEARPCFGYSAWPVPPPDQPGGPEGPALPPPLDLQDPDPPKDRITLSLFEKFQKLTLKENFGFIEDPDLKM